MVTKIIRQSGLLAGGTAGEESSPSAWLAAELEAVAHLDALWPDPRRQGRAEQWLAEGVDVVESILRRAMVDSARRRAEPLADPPLGQLLPKSEPRSDSGRRVP